MVTGLTHQCPFCWVLQSGPIFRGHLQLTTFRLGSASLIETLSKYGLYNEAAIAACTVWSDELRSGNGSCLSAEAARALEAVVACLTSKYACRSVEDFLMQDLCKSTSLDDSFWYWWHEACEKSGFTSTVRETQLHVPQIEECVQGTANDTHYLPSSVELFTNMNNLWKPLVRWTARDQQDYWGLSRDAQLEFKSRCVMTYLSDCTIPCSDLKLHLCFPNKRCRSSKPSLFELFVLSYASNYLHTYDWTNGLTASSLLRRTTCGDIVAKLYRQMSTWELKGLLPKQLREIEVNELVDELPLRLYAYTGRDQSNGVAILEPSTIKSCTSTRFETATIWIQAKNSESEILLNDMCHRLCDMSERSQSASSYPPIHGAVPTTTSATVPKQQHSPNADGTNDIQPSKSLNRRPNNIPNTGEHRLCRRTYRFPSVSIQRTKKRRSTEGEWEREFQTGSTIRQSSTAHFSEFNNKDTNQESMPNGVLEAERNEGNNIEDSLPLLGSQPPAITTHEQLASPSFKCYCERQLSTELLDSLAGRTASAPRAIDCIWLKKRKDDLYTRVDAVNRDSHGSLKVYFPAKNRLCPQTPYRPALLWTPSCETNYGRNSIRRTNVAAKYKAGRVGDASSKDAASMKLSTVYDPTLAPSAAASFTSGIGSFFASKDRMAAREHNRPLSLLSFGSDTDLPSLNSMFGLSTHDSYS